MPAKTFARPSLLVVGTGALGSALLDRLRANRFASVLLVDPDAVQPHNLPLSPLLRRAAAHLFTAQTSSTYEATPPNKAELLSRYVAELDGLPWRALPSAIADVGWAELQDIDLICCCTDSVLSRVETSWAARALGKPMLDGGVKGEGIAEGRVTLYPHAAAAACALCGLSEDRRAAVLGFAASVSLGCQPPENAPAMTGTLDTLGATANAMLAQVQRWPELVTDRAITTRLTKVQDVTWHTETVELSPSATCPWHSGPPGSLKALPWREPFRNHLGPSQEIVLNWPVCTEAVCTACNARTRPNFRVGRLRVAACPTCGEFAQQPTAAIHRIRNGDPSSGNSPRQLGMPDRHLYWVRDTAQP